jgi:hypothetical protein
MSRKIYYNGRYDGIGNRLEELLHLEHYCMSNDLTCSYYWDNSGNADRRYPIFFECEHIDIQDNIKYSENTITRITYFSNRDQMTSAIKNIRFIKPLEIQNCEYTGVHIRTGDRIQYPVPHGDFMDAKLFRKIFNFAIKQINLERPEYLFICSDNEDYKNEMISELNKTIKVIDPLITKHQLQVYNDFHALSKANKIYMCSKFSSFAITASMFNDIPLISFFEKDESNLMRYHANVNVLKLPTGKTVLNLLDMALTSARKFFSKTF